MEFSRIEMVAVMKLGMQIAAADGKLAEEEASIMSINAMSFGIDSDDLKSILSDTQHMKPELALAAVAAMNDKQKRYVTAYLGTIIAADGDIDDSEMKLWRLISSLCDLPTMSILEALDIMEKEM